MCIRDSCCPQHPTASYPYVIYYLYEQSFLPRHFSCRFLLREILSWVYGPGVQYINSAVPGIAYGFAPASTETAEIFLPLNRNTSTRRTDSSRCRSSRWSRSKPAVMRCAGSVQYRSLWVLHVVDHAGCMAPTRPHELEITTHEESVFPERSRSWTAVGIDYVDHTDHTDHLAEVWKLACQATIYVRMTS